MKTAKLLLTLCFILLAQMIFAQQKLTFQRSTSFPCGSNVLYTGAVKNGKANGYGKAFISYDKITDTLSPHIWIYEGYWKDNDFNGKGNLYKNSVGDWYKGNFSNGQLHGQGEAYSYYNRAIKKGVFVQGEYKGNPAGQKTLDSLLLIYKPLLKTITSTQNTVQKFVEEIKKLPQDIVKKPYSDLVAELANNNIQSTFYLVLEAPYYFKNDELVAQLSSSQKEEVKKIAQKIVDDYNNKQKAATTNNTTAPAVSTTPKFKTQREKIDALLNEKKLKVGKTYASASTFSWQKEPTYYLLSYIDYEKGAIWFDNMSIPFYEKKDGTGRIKANIFEYNGKLMISDWASDVRLSNKQYHTCPTCKGTGSEEITVTKTRVKELPQGYFDGIQTKSIRTTTTTEKQGCRNCRSCGMILK